MRFKEAVLRSNPPACDHYQSGLRALGTHSHKIACADTRRLTGSLDLDTCLCHVPEHRNAPRWDYGIGYRKNGSGEAAIWVEIHHATTSEVDAVLRKLEWLRQWLRTHGPELAQLTESSDAFHWLSTDVGNSIPKTSPQARKLAAAGLPPPRRILELS